MILSDADVSKIKQMLGDSPERCIIADCVYKYGSFQGFSFSLSDTKGKYVSIPYSDAMVDDYADLTELLAVRKNSQMKDDAASMLGAVAKVLCDLGLEIKDEELAGLIDLSHPVLLLNAGKH